MDERFTYPGLDVEEINIYYRPSTGVLTFSRYETENTSVALSVDAHDLDAAKTLIGALGWELTTEFIYSPFAKDWAAAAMRAGSEITGTNLVVRMAPSPSADPRELLAELAADEVAAYLELLGAFQ